MDPILLALLGGSIGAVLTLVVTLTVGIPVEIRHHDRLAVEIDEDLAQWVSDECVRLERELMGNKNSAGNQLYSGAFLARIASLKEQALHQYRDQERLAQRRRAMLLDDEGWRHRFYRWWIARDQFPELETPAKAAPILDGWRAKVVARSGGEAPVSDPTKRSLDWALGKYGGDCQHWDQYTA
jgi:hypothetical protein